MNFEVTQLTLSKAFILLLFSYGLLSAAEMEKCSDAKTGGTCSDIVDTAINVCEEKQKDHEITHKTLKKSQETSFSRSTNFGQLISKYKDTEKSAKKSVSAQKACGDAAKALKKDCQDKCDGSDSSSCESGLEALDDIRQFCKKKEEEAEAIAEQAAVDAASIEAAARDITQDTSSSSSLARNLASSTGTTSVTTGAPRPSGSQGLNSFLNVTGTPIDNSGGDGSGSASGGGSNSGSTSGAGSTNSGDGVGLVGGAAGALGGAKNNDDASKSAADNAADLAAAAARYGAGAFPDKSKEKESSASSKSAEGEHGYMFVGIPTRKKKRPTLLNRELASPLTKKRSDNIKNPIDTNINTNVQEKVNSTNLDYLK